MRECYSKKGIPRRLGTNVRSLLRRSGNKARDKQFTCVGDANLSKIIRFGMEA